MESHRAYYYILCNYIYFVGENGAGVGEAEQRMVREHGAYVHEASVNDGLVCQCGEGRVAVHDRYLLAY